jgi:hypothetical protein
MPELLPLESIRTEKAFQAEVTKFAESYGWTVNFTRRSMVQQGGAKRWVTNTSVKGWPDLCCLHPDGYVIFLELKGVDGKPSDEQIEVMRTLQAIASVIPQQRFRAFVAYPQEWPRLARMFTLPERRRTTLAGPITVTPEGTPR